MERGRLHLRSFLLASLTLMAIVKEGRGLETKTFAVSLPSLTHLSIGNICLGEVIITADSTQPNQITVTSDSTFFDQASVGLDTTSFPGLPTLDFLNSFSGISSMVITLNLNPSSTQITTLQSTASVDVYADGAVFSSVNASRVLTEGSGSIYVYKGRIESNMEETVLTSQSSGSICVGSVTALSSVTALVYGSGDVTIGSATDVISTLNAYNTGSGNVVACSAACSNAAVTLKGSGDVTVSASSNIFYAITGSGGIYYDTDKNPTLRRSEPSLSVPLSVVCDTSPTSCPSPPTLPPTFENGRFDLQHSVGYEGVCQTGNGSRATRVVNTTLLLLFSVWSMLLLMN